MPAAEMLEEVVCSMCALYQPSKQCGFTSAIAQAMPLLRCCAFKGGCQMPAGGEQGPDSGSSGGSAWHHVPDGSEDDDTDLPPPVHRSWAQRLLGNGGGVDC